MHYHRMWFGNVLTEDKIQKSNKMGYSSAISQDRENFVIVISWGIVWQCIEIS